MFTITYSELFLNNPIYSNYVYYDSTVFSIEINIYFNQRFSDNSLIYYDKNYVMCFSTAGILLAL